MKRALVTGASGFVGQHLVRSLLSNGWTVICFVRDANRLPDSVRDKAVVIETDITKVGQHSGVFEEVDCIFHLAAKTHDLNATELHRVNAEGTAAIAKVAAQANHAPVFVHISSLAATGPSPTGQPCNEATLPRPVSKYGRSKLAAEQNLRSWAEQLPVTIVRPGVIFGGHSVGTWQLLAPIVKMGIHLVPGWNSRRVSIIHAEDFVRLLMLVVERGERIDAAAGANSGKGVYCIGTTEQPTYVELGRIMADAVGRKRVFNLRIANWSIRFICLIAETIHQLRRKSAILGIDKARELVSPNWTCDISKISQLGFLPAKSMAERWKETADWYREHGYFRASHQQPSRAETYSNQSESGKM